jgi:hypothetical protein
VDAEPPPDSLSLTPEEKEAAAAYLRTTFRMHPIDPEDQDAPSIASPAPPTGTAAVKLVLLKKEPDHETPA